MSNSLSGRQTMIVPIIRRADLSVATFRAYWRAVHGPVAARLAGLDFYEQLHLAPEARLVGAVPAVFGGDVCDGLAVLSFPSPEALDAYRALGPIMPADEANAFRFAVRYDVPARADGLAALPRALATEPEERRGALAFVRRAAGVSGEAFATGLTSLAGALERAPGVRGVWLDLPAPRTVERPAPEAVDRYTPEARQFQAVLRVCAGEGAAARLAEALEASAVVGAARVQAVAEAPLFVFDGAMTLGAVRGAEAAGLIDAQGARNQLDAGLLALFVPPGRRVDPTLA